MKAKFEIGSTYGGSRPEEAAMAIPAWFPGNKREVNDGCRQALW